MKGIPCILLPNLVCYRGFLILIGLLPHCVCTFEEHPTLECLADGLRLHFKPDQPFYGHIYVKGFFMRNSCHLDYTRNPLYDPFLFHVPYRSGCNVKREKQSNPPGVNYHVVIIIQHHYLFLTQADKAYSVNCFYRESYAKVAQDMEVSPLSPTELKNGDAVPECNYEVLRDSVNGEPVKYANIGDRLIHRWSCRSEEYGMLVHSCLVRDPSGIAFQLIDDRGCITDHTLIDPLAYGNNLTVAHSLVPAFKFADQLIVHFQCKITLCTKENNGCEGITPPSCKIISNPDAYPPESISGEAEEQYGHIGKPEDNMPGSAKKNGSGGNKNSGSSGSKNGGEKSGSGSNKTVTVQPTEKRDPEKGKLLSEAGKVAQLPELFPLHNSGNVTTPDVEHSGYTNADDRDSDMQGSSQSGNYGDQSIHIGATMTAEQEQISYRKMRSLDKAGGLMQSQQFRKLHMQANNSIDPANASSINRLTFDVNADQLVVFGGDEASQGETFGEVPHVLCQVSRNGLLLQTAMFILLSILIVSLIFLQKRFYDKHLLEIGAVIPNYKMHSQRWQI